MSRMLQVMEKNGWIHEVDNGSGKEKAFSLTREGQVLVSKVMPLRLQVQNRILGRLSEQEQKLLFTLCDKLKDEIQD
jgi:DNA-binding MarR family transcriptional regulator